MNKFNLLSDQPLKSETDFESAKFGHKEIAETLTSLIINCPTPFTIGLFGRWGAGKSTISYMLKKAMSENKFGFVLFDVWKHESDALRRTFLKESVKQLKEQKNIPKDFNLEERIDSKITRKVEGQLQLKDFLKKYWRISLLVLLCLILAGILIYQFLGLENLKSYISTVLSIIAGGGIITAIISKAMSLFLTSETITHEIDRFKDPHEFQSEFEKLLLNLKTDKILVVFDNLDRVTHEKAVGILATIKTFLETENVKDIGVVFLIPCDDRAIKEHLRNVYKLSDGGKDAFSEEEFLRKFFNTTLRIPYFYPTELETYAMELLNQTGIMELKEGSVAWLVTKAYRQNPRQIKQFINQLIGMYILAKKRIEKNILPADFLTGNTAKLAKFLILYNKFPNQMEKLRQDKIWDTDKIISITTPDSELAEFIKFINETSHIPINNLNIFFALRRSEFEVILPGYDELVAALQDNRVEEVTSYMKALPEFAAKRAILSQAIKKLLEEANLPDTKISIINSCLTALNRLNNRLGDTLYVEVFNELSNLKQYLPIIEPSVIFDQLLKPYPQHRNNLAQIYIDILTIEDKNRLPVKFVETLFSGIINNQEWFNQHVANLIKIIIEKYYDQPQIIQALLLNDKIQKTFKVGKILQKTMSTLSPADLETGKPFDDKLNLIISAIPEVLDKELVSITIIKLTEIFANENTKPFDSSRIEIKKRLSQDVTSLLKKHRSAFSERSKNNEKEQLCSVVINGINQISVWVQKSIYVEPLNILSSISPNSSNQIINTIKQVIDNTPIKDIIKDSSYEKVWRELVHDSNYTGHIKQWALRDQLIFDYFYRDLAETQKRDWILELLNTDPNRSIQIIDSLDKLPDDTVNVLRKLLTVSKTVSIHNHNRFKAYEICDRFKFANNNDLLQDACEDVKRYSTTMDEPSQKLAFDLSENISSFSDTHKRDIARAVIDWLVSLQSTQAYQKFSIRTVLHLWTTLNGQSIIQKKFIEHIFSLLLGTTNIDAIKLGIEVLDKTRPNYNDFSKYYEDLKHRTETEQNIAFKNIFIKGFQDLKKTIDDHAEWWKWVEPIEEK